MSDVLYLNRIVHHKENESSLVEILGGGITDDVVKLACIEPGQGPTLCNDECELIASVCSVEEELSFQAYLSAFISLTTVLVKIADSRQLDIVHPDNALLFADLLENPPEPMLEKPLKQHFDRCFNEALQSIAAETHLLTLVNQYDNALFFADILYGVLNDKELVTMMCEGIASYEDFQAWQHYLVLQSYREEFDEDEAA